jgi:hypothetical protein
MVQPKVCSLKQDEEERHPTPGEIPAADQHDRRSGRVAVFAFCRRSLVNDHSSPRTLPLLRMAEPAGNSFMGAGQVKCRIPVMIEPLRLPVSRRVTTLAASGAAPVGELFPVHVFMAIRAQLRGSRKGHALDPELAR